MSPLFSQKNDVHVLQQLSIMCQSFSQLILVSVCQLQNYDDSSRFVDNVSLLKCVCLFAGNVINIQTGEWVGQMSGLGAGLDSFYEYLLKVSIHVCFFIAYA